MIWFGFALVYQLARGLANQRSPQEAFANGIRVFNLETHSTIACTS